MEAFGEFNDQCYRYIIASSPGLPLLWEKIRERKLSSGKGSTEREDGLGWPGNEARYIRLLQPVSEEYFLFVINS